MTRRKRPIPGANDQVTRKSEPELFYAIQSAKEILNVVFNLESQLQENFFRYHHIINVYMKYVELKEHLRTTRIKKGVATLLEAIDHFEEAQKKFRKAHLSLTI